MGACGNSLSVGAGLIPARKKLWTYFLNDDLIVLMDPIKTVLNKVKKTIAGFNMIDPGDRVIVAVSGGPDSVCLLDVLRELMGELDINLVVAHYNHGLRPKEDDSETEFTRQFAASFNLPFESGNAPPFKNGSGTSLEEKARDARYGFLLNVKRTHSAQKIALGHNLNDQAETVIMRLLRGSGPSGLAGIPPCRDHAIIRPMIRIKREAVENYLDVRGLSSIVDSSNLEPGFLRNKIRLDLIPALQKYQPRLIERLGQTAEILRDENVYMDLMAAEWVRGHAEFGPAEEMTIPLAPFTVLPRALRKRIIRHSLKRIRKNLRRLDHSHILSIDRLARGGKSQGVLNLPGRIMVQRTYDRLMLTAEMGPKPLDFHYVLDGPGMIDLKEIERVLSLAEMEGGLSPDTGHERCAAFLDAEKLTYPLAVRNFRAGDRFIPLGMTGHKKIKDFFIDLKIPSEERRAIPLMVCGDHIVWVCGHRIDDRYKVTPITKKILRATLI